MKRFALLKNGVAALPLMAELSLVYSVALSALLMLPSSVNDCNSVPSGGVLGLANNNTEHTATSCGVPTRPRGIYAGVIDKDIKRTKYPWAVLKQCVYLITVADIDL